MSDITPPVIIRKTHTSTEILDRTGNTIESHTTTTTDVFYRAKGSTLNEFTSPNGTITNTLRVVKEGVHNSALCVRKLGQLLIPPVKRGVHWGFGKTFQAAKTVIPHIKLSLTKLGNVLTNNILSSQQQNDPTERNIGAADTASTSTSDSANLPDHLVSDQARSLLTNESSSHQVLLEACSALAEQLSYCSNPASSSRVMNGEPLRQVTAGKLTLKWTIPLS